MKSLLVASFVALCSAAVSPKAISYEPKRAVPAMRKRSFQYRVEIEDLIDNLSEEMVINHVTYLSGESSDSTLETRVSASSDYLQASSWVRDQMASWGFESTLDDYSTQFGPNVISVLRGQSEEEFVIVGAHLDDIPSSGRAPGANDDGSGSAALMAMAQTIFESGATFEKTIVFEHYSGEEQGLVGSRNLAARRSANNDPVFAQLQMDMVGVALEQDPIGLAFVQDSRAVDTTLTAYVLEVARQYADQRLTIYSQVISGSSCCSDHQSYHENGFSSVGMIEPRGYTGDPQYHRSGDLVNRTEYSTLQVALTGRVSLAALADLAGLL